MAVYLEQIFGEASVNSFLSLSRNYFSLNQRQDEEYVCFDAVQQKKKCKL